MLGIGAFPLYMVYGRDGFVKGFIMNRLPDTCYSIFDNNLEERNLSCFYNDVGNYQDHDLVHFVVKLLEALSFFHKNGICMGDVLSPYNTCVNIYGGKLYPYFIDTDSMIRGDMFPFHAISV